MEAYGRRQLTRQCRPARCADPAKPPRPAGGAANSGRAARNLGSARVGTYLRARYLLGLSSPRAEPYTGIGVDSTFLSAWSIIDGCTLQTRFLEILRIFGTTTTRHMIGSLDSQVSTRSESLNGRDARMATHHISAHRTHRRCILRFSPHDLVCTEHSQLYPLRPPSSDSFDGLITPVVSLSSLRALRHLFGSTFGCRRTCARACSPSMHTVPASVP